MASDDVQRSGAWRSGATLKTVPAIGRISAGDRRRLADVAQQVPADLRVDDPVPRLSVPVVDRRRSGSALQRVVVGTKDRRR